MTPQLIEQAAHALTEAARTGKFIAPLRETYVQLTIDDAYAISKQQVSDYLGGIPEQKMLCSNLAPEAIRQAIDNYRGK